MAVSVMALSSKASGSQGRSLSTASISLSAVAVAPPWRIASPRHSRAQGEGPRIRAASLGEFKDIDRRVVHGYSNTFSVRAGGGYNLEAAGGVFTLRAGSYFDSSATRFAYTRVDVDTLTKIAGTLGVGYRRGAVGIDVGYAAVASLPRGVGEGQGEIRPANDAKNGEPVDSRGGQMPSVNEGEYRGVTHVFALGMTLSFDALFGVSRRVHFRDRYEPAYVGPGS